MRHLRAISCLIAFSITVPAAWAADARLDVFAAASTTEAIEAIAAAFGEAHGVSVRPSFASSSTLARQIDAGAPADIYLSAHPRWMEYLLDRKRVEPDSVRTFAGNRLVVIVRTGTEALSLDQLATLRVASGDPEHVPAGIYAKQYLERLSLWTRMEMSLIRAKDVRAALALVARGEVDAGIVYRTDARISEEVEIAFEAAAGQHEPIVYPLAIVVGARRMLARSFIDFVVGPQGQELVQRFGFLSAVEADAAKQ